MPLVVSIESGRESKKVEIRGKVAKDLFREIFLEVLSRVENKKKKKKIFNKLK